MNPFRLGDYIRVSGTDGAVFGENEIVKVVQIAPNFVVKRFDGRHVATDPSSINFVFVNSGSVEKEQSELVKLVAVANAGQKAESELVKRYSEYVEVRPHTTNVWTGDIKGLNPYEWRVKVKPKEFASFRVGKDWCVAVTADRVLYPTLHIGCETFDFNDVLNVLCELKRNHGYDLHLKNFPVKNTWAGIEWNGATITHEEARKLLSAMEEYMAP